MTKIHHATQKKATEAGLTIKANEDGSFAVYGKGKTPIFEADDAKIALAEAMEILDTAGEAGGKSELIKRKYVERYMPNDRSCGDNVAEDLKAATTYAEEIKPGKFVNRTDMVALGKIATANGVDLSRWDHLNNGMTRMNLGNVLRGMARKGQEISI